MIIIALALAVAYCCLAVGQADEDWADEDWADDFKAQNRLPAICAALWVWVGTLAGGCTLGVVLA